MPTNIIKSMPAAYVKFVRGTPTAFENLSTKNADTLYFISEQNATSGKLYLGSKLISGSTDISALGDILISSLGDKDILVYDENEQAWVNSDIQTVIGIMTGATANANGTSGLVPVPQAGDQNKFLRGDGNWASPVITTDSNVFTQNNNSELTLVGLDNAQEGSLLQVGSSGGLEWVDPSTLQTDLSSVEQSISNLESVVGTLTSTKLQRQIVSSINDIDVNNASSNTIYMVPDSNQNSGNLYNEYMVINGALELIGGNYEGDLNGYVTTVQLNQEVGELESSISSLDSRLDAIEGDYVTLDQYNDEVGDLTQLIYSQNNGNTLVDQINDLTERLTWYLISNEI